jgi:hypothetical protein
MPRSGWERNGAMMRARVFFVGLVLVLGCDKPSEKTPGMACDPDGSNHGQCVDGEVCIIKTHVEPRWESTIGRKSYVPGEAGICKPVEWFCENRCEYDKGRSDWLKKKKPDDPDAGHVDRTWGTQEKCVANCLEISAKHAAESK